MHGLSGPRSSALILATLLFCNATLAGVLANVGSPTPEKFGVPSSSLLATRASLVAPQSPSSAATPAPYEIVLSTYQISACFGSPFDVPFSVLPGTLSSAVTLTVRGLPAGASASIEPSASGTPPFYAVLNVTVPQSNVPSVDSLIVSAGHRAQATLSISVRSCSPFLSVQVLPSVGMGVAPLAVQFTAYTSGGGAPFQATGYGINGYSANLTGESGEGSNVTNPGGIKDSTYNLTLAAGLNALHVTAYAGSPQGNNITAEGVSYVAVGSPPQNLFNFSISPLAGLAPLNVTFADSCPSTVAWLVGNHTVQGAAGYYTLTAPGVYPVWASGPGNTPICGETQAYGSNPEAYIAVAPNLPFASDYAWSNVYSGSFPLPVQLNGTSLGCGAVELGCSPGSGPVGPFNWTIRCPPAAGEELMGPEVSTTLTPASTGETICKIEFGNAEATFAGGMIIGTSSVPVSPSSPLLSWWPYSQSLLALIGLAASLLLLVAITLVIRRRRDRGAPAPRRRPGSGHAPGSTPPQSPVILPVWSTLPIKPPGPAEPGQGPGPPPRLREPPVRPPTQPPK